MAVFDGRGIDEIWKKAFKVLNVIGLGVKCWARREHREMWSSGNSKGFRGHLLHSCEEKIKVNDQ